MTERFKPSRRFRGTRFNFPGDYCGMYKCRFCKKTAFYNIPTDLCSFHWRKWWKFELEYEEQIELQKIIKEKITDNGSDK